ncbi:hypothetical protein BGC07_02710 [Piscirickettsia litoralis]|uniref:Transposase n=1 Tax=Piscirickettsia litoralis TaxID=1891921 RepID=A0ABX2ZZS4_9GAMM|nr:hypothetical protein BGC07_02710 [Piscirickettsia litoralis]
MDRYANRKPIDFIPQTSASNKIEASMAGVGSCLDNAPVECFFDSLKNEKQSPHFYVSAKVEFLCFSFLIFLKLIGDKFASDS